MKNLLKKYIALYIPDWRSDHDFILPEDAERALFMTLSMPIWGPFYLVWKIAQTVFVVLMLAFGAVLVVLEKPGIIIARWINRN